ncbi:MAG: hypothetical protein TR69_WS6001000561 [candidate division WS6 bacterium OLB20]|uniref:Uncharacterized protein n=1 Tax=candidate division WS6 bacterium OLB20 TaxID=1617426 RepID=A0A136LY32_9BACT|nr:MAG: hypothetical protein TR69_WS6001000561 [candidate division WS6 bacterium OLB20]
MRRILLTTAALFFLTAFAAAPVAAQDTNASLSLSPAIQIVEEDDLGKTFTIKLTNNTGSDVTITPELTGVVRGEDGKTVPAESVPEDSIDFATEPFTVPAGQTYDFPVRVRLTLSEVDTFPAVSFTAASGEEQVALNTSLVSIFLVQNVAGSLGIDSDLAVNPGVVALQPDFSISGSVLNTGGKFYNPSGSIRISRDGQVLHEEEITTQIQGLLFPEESRTFASMWRLDQNFPESIGTYEIEVRITPNPFEQTHVARIQVFYLPLEVLVVGVPVFIVILSLTGYIFLRKNKAAR